VINMETNTRTQTHASNQLSTEGKLPLKWALDDLEYQIDRIAYGLKIDVTSGRPIEEMPHGIKMYCNALHKMKNAVKEMLRKEVE